MKTKYDWSGVNTEIKWIATDSDGGVFGYTHKKMPINDGDFILARLTRGDTE